MSSSQKLEDEGVMETTGKVLIATIIALFFVLLLIFCFHIYARWLWHRRQQSPDYNNNNNARVRQDQHSAAAAGVTVLRRGLDTAFLKTIPVLQFESKDFKDGLECSVCLSELVDGEKARILPKCNHVFHAECIDMWFHSHSTCPICRNPVSEEQTQVSVDSLLLIQQNQQQQQQESNNNDGDSFPTNVLFWGDETQVSTLTSQLGELEANNTHLHSDHPTTTSSTSSSSHTNIINDTRMKPDLVIHIPTATATQHLVGNDDDETPTPIMASLRRILSSSRRFYPFSPSPNNISN